MKTRYKVGDKVRLTADALAHYGEQYKGEHTVTHVSTSYMPAKEFYAKGAPQGYHPGYDESAGCALYDCADLSFSLYDWELAR